MNYKRFKDKDPFADVVKIWDNQEAQNIARKLWPKKEWTKEVELLELHADGEYLINGDPFTKSTPVHRTSYH